MKKVAIITVWNAETQQLEEVVFNEGDFPFPEEFWTEVEE